MKQKKKLPKLPPRISPNGHDPRVMMMDLLSDYVHFLFTDNELQEMLGIDSPWRVEAELAIYAADFLVQSGYGIPD